MAESYIPQHHLSKARTIPAQGDENSKTRQLVRFDVVFSPQVCALTVFNLGAFPPQLSREVQLEVPCLGTIRAPCVHVQWLPTSFQDFRELPGIASWAESAITPLPLASRFSNVVLSRCQRQRLRLRIRLHVSANSRIALWVELQCSSSIISKRRQCTLTKAQCPDPKI